MKSWLQSLCGGIAVYVVMAACSGDGGKNDAVAVQPEAGAGGVSTEDSGRPASDAARGDATQREAGLVDRLVSPVRDARAQDAGETGALIVTKQCDVTDVSDVWAVVEVPGRSAESLTGARVVVPKSPPLSASTFTLTHVNGDVAIGDGVVAHWCGPPGALPYTQVTFYVP